MRLKKLKMNLVFPALLLLLILNMFMLINNLKMNEKSNVNETLYQHAFFENYFFDNLEEKEFPGILKQINDTGKYKLVACFSKTNCSSCVDNELLRISKLKSLIGSDNILIICNYSDELQLNSTFSFEGIENIMIIRDDNCAFLFSEFDIKMPFYFILDSTVKAKKIFQPSSQKHWLTEKYFSYILSNYFNK